MYKRQGQTGVDINGVVPARFCGVEGDRRYFVVLVGGCLLYTSNFDRDLSFGGCGNADEGFLYIVADDEELKGMLESQINGTIPTTEEEHQRAVEHYEFFNDPVTVSYTHLDVYKRQVYT